MGLIGPLLVSLVVLLAIGWIHHRPFLAKLRQREPPTADYSRAADLPTPLDRQIGYFEADKQSAGLGFPKEPPHGVLRVCAFGDSFTYGSEVDAAHDYPSLLQRIAERQGASIEVLNFGTPNIGFGQTWLLWDAFAGPYRCDVTLLGPATFFPDRDTSFHHAGPGDPSYLHARFILEGDGVALVEVPGADWVGQFESYWGFLPPWEVARYDRSPPAVLRSVLGPRRTITNPLYYSALARKAEARKIWHRLVARMTERGRVLLGYAASSAAAQPPIPAGDFEDVPIAWPRHFPYRAPRNHFGPLGNDLVARFFLSRLGGSAAASTAYPLLRTHWLHSAAAGLSSGAVASAPLGRRVPLGEFEEIEFAIDGTNLGQFSTGLPPTRATGRPDLAKRRGVVSLLHVGGPARAGRQPGTTSPLDGCFLRLERPLVEGETVWLAERGERRPIGTVRSFAPSINLGWIDYETGGVFGPASDFFGDPLHYRAAGGARAGTGAARIVVGDTPILSGRWSQQRLRLRPVANGRACWRARATPSGFVDPDDLPAAGTVDVVLRRARGDEVRIPIARWSKTPRELPRPSVNAAGS